MRRQTHAHTPGSPPGLLTPSPGACRTHVSVMAYDHESILEEVLLDEARGTDGEPPVQPGRMRELVAPIVSRLAELRERWPVLWVDVDGLRDTDVIQGIGDLFGLHSLVLEDVTHVMQRPKVEEYETYDFIVMRMVHEDISPDTEQLAIVLADGYVLTFQEQPGDCLEPVRERIRRSIGKVRRTGADYLAYAIIDAVVDHYVPLLEWYGERIEALERSIIAAPRPGLLSEVYALKSELHGLRRVLVPLSSAVGSLDREEVPRFSPDLEPYLRDCHDHSVRLLDSLEICRESAAGLPELYMSANGQRMNEVMKVLTMIATIFIPLSFIAGIYGMNFDTKASRWNMPELTWAYGYPFALSVMLLITVLLLFYFRRKGWLGGGQLPRSGSSGSGLDGGDGEA